MVWTRKQIKFHWNGIEMLAIRFNGMAQSWIEDFGLILSTAGFCKKKWDNRGRLPVEFQNCYWISYQALYTFICQPITCMYYQFHGWARRRYFSRTAFHFGTMLTMPTIIGHVEEAAFWLWLTVLTWYDAIYTFLFEWSTLKETIR